MGSLLPMGPVRLAAHGLSVTLPRQWEGRLYLRDAPALDAREPASSLVAAAARLVSHPAAYGWPGEIPNPVLHLANFALPPSRGDFGTGAVESMAAGHVFVCLFEYDREEAGRPLFAASGMPRPLISEFSANALQRRLAGQGGWQRFFTESGRAFSLYVVLGSLRRAAPVVPVLRGVLDGIQIGPRIDAGGAEAL